MATNWSTGDPISGLQLHMDALRGKYQKPNYISKVIDENDGAWKGHPLPKKPNKHGFLEVSKRPHHEIYWEEYGNPKGEPVMFFHGGPGGMMSPTDARFFDPKRYRIILFDQRGCGQSKPNAADDPKTALTDNDTPHLIKDIEKLRDKLHIHGKMHILGGSWGATLALAYAIEHPTHVQSLVLRGVFLCRKKDLDYFYQGNAENYHIHPLDTTLSGAYTKYREAWKDFVEVIPVEKRGDMVAAYAEIFNRTPKNEAEQQYQDRAVQTWTRWEGIASYLSQDLSNLGKFGELKFSKAFAKIENHYFMNGCFLGGKHGEKWRNNNYLLENIDKIRDIPVHIVQGQFDEVCPRFQADELVAALVRAGATDIDYRLTPAGHSRLERENVRLVTEVMDTLPVMTRADMLPQRDKHGRAGSK